MTKCRIGTAPVSWGVWFPKDEKQIPWARCLDEIASSGYEGIELGPWGYFPTNFKKLSTELNNRNLKLISTTLMDDLTTVENTDKMIEQLDEMASLQTKFADAKYVVLIDACYTDLFTGKQIRNSTLSDEEKDIFYNNIDRIRKHAEDNYGLTTVFHPHAQTHIETEEQIIEFLERTTIDLCFDTGHHSFMGGNVEEFIKKYHQRISYIHLKNCDEVILRQTNEKDWSLAEAVNQGVMVEPSAGLVDMEKVATLLKEYQFDGWIIVEQDMYPAPFDKPYPIAKRTRQYLADKKIG